MCEWTGWSVPSRRDGGVCGLSDVLEPMSPSLRKYFLSPTALKGILRRADARGKALPTLLRDAIEWMLGWWETRPQEEQGGGIDAIALDGDKLKPREDQRKGGNGFGINEEGAGYTLTGVDRHGVAYETQVYENHAQDSRVQGPIDTAPTQGSSNANSAGVSGNNPLVCFSKVSHPHAPNGEGERWDEREVAQTRNTFDNGEKRCQEVVVSTQGLDGYNKTLTGDCAPTISGAACDLHHTHGVISTNSNGEDVAPTISSCEYKMGQKQKDTDHTDLVVHEKEGAEGE